MKAVKTMLAVAACAAVSVAVYAAVAFDVASGTGFVGKGDVQLLYGWNNKQLNDNAGAVQFRVSVVSTVATTWTCDKDTGPQTQERSNTKTTSSLGIVSKVARENKTKQITGFLLEGYSGGEPTETSTSAGPAVGSCPTGWTAINLVVGEEEVLGGGLEVSADGATWTSLPNTPVL